jgi:ADP-heptose:LPS heptosyltransferase
VSLCSLQKGDGSEQLFNGSAPGLRIHDFGSRTAASFADTAALIHSLDLVISVDTAAAHVAGALGVPVWLLLPFVADWRWLRDRDDSPWYPSMRLFRQSKRGDWDSVLTRVADELRKRANSSK